MKPIDTLVKLGIIRRGARLVGTGEPSWIIDNPQKFVVMDESQVLSNKDVMAAVMVMLRKRGFSWLLASILRHRCRTEPDGQAMVTTHWDAQIVDDNDITAIILAGLQALEGK